MNKQTEDLAALLRTQGCRMLDLCDRMTVLEAEIAFIRGTILARHLAETPTEITHDVAPNAPR